MTDRQPLGKRPLRALLAQHGVPGPRFAVADGPGQVRALLARFGYPAVVKPAGLTGGRGVYLVTAPQQLPGWAAMLAQSRYDGPVLVEEHLAGREVSVEFASAGGEHRFTGIIERELSLPPLFVEMGHAVSGGRPQAPEGAERIAAAALTAAGHRDGGAYVVLRLCAGGPRVVGLGQRSAADPVTRLPGLAGDGHAAALSYFWLPAGEVESVAGTEEIRALGHVHELVFPFGPGDRLPQTIDALTRHGHVTVTAPSAAAAAARIAAVKQRLSVTVRSRPAVTVPRPRTARRVASIVS